MLKSWYVRSVVDRSITSKSCSAIDVLNASYCDISYDASRCCLN